MQRELPFFLTLLNAHCILHLPLASLTMCPPQSIISCIPVIYHSRSFGLSSERCSRIYKSDKILLCLHNTYHLYLFHVLSSKNGSWVGVFWGWDLLRGKKYNGIFWQTTFCIWTWQEIIHQLTTYFRPIVCLVYLSSTENLYCGVHHWSRKFMV